MTEENKKEPEKISYEIEFEANSNEELLEKIKQTFVKEDMVLHKICKMQ